MSFRNVYAAPLTPGFVDLSIVHPQSGVHQSLSTPETPDHEDDLASEAQSRWCAVVSAIRVAVDNNAGLLLVAASQAFFSLMNLSVKMLNNLDPPVSALEIIIVRMALTWILCIAYMLWAKIPDPFFGPKDVRLLLLFRGFSGFFGLFGMYFSLQYLSLSDAVVLTFLAPFCAGIAGSIFLGESFTRKEAFASLFSLFGVVLIARPAFIFGSHVHISGSADKLEKGTPAQRLLAVGVALIGVLGATGAYISIRAIGKRATPLHAMVSFSTFCVVIASIGFVASKEPFVMPTRWDWLALLVLIGIFGFIAQVLLTMGVRRENVSRSTIALYSHVVFAMLLERLFFNSSPSALSLVGTLIILSSALYVALTREVESIPKSNYTRLESISEEGLEEGLLEPEGREHHAKGEHHQSSQQIKDLVDAHPRAHADNVGSIS